MSVRVTWRGEERAAWRALVAVVVTIILAAGSRTSLAAFLKPIEADLGLDRAVLSNAGALTVLTYGLAQPLVGGLAGRFGPRNVMLGGIALTAAGGFGVANATQPWQLYVWAGIIPGLGFAGASSIPATVLLAGWFSSRLGLATGIMSAAIPAGQSLFVPLATTLVVGLGWRQTYIALGVMVACIAVPILVWLARDPPALHSGTSSTHSQVRPKAGLDIWLIGVGYFACGFADQFVLLHLIALAADRGLDPLLAAGVLSLVLLIGIIGSVASGPLADRVPARYLLAGLYVTRAVSFPLLLLAGPGGGLAALALFALLFGPTYIANQAPGARLVRDRYGVRAVGPLMGTVGLAHQVGGALGVGLGGLSVSQFGGYDLAIIVVAAVALLGGVSQLWIPKCEYLPAR
ncbi:MAG TPA: MFS transporter [Chloroflexota bacterium]|nr:MFS transporter [Chloroflexota bacterium]